MTWPPYLMQVKVSSPEHDFSLWLPLFIIGPIALIFMLVLCLIALPFLFLSFMFTWRCDWWPYVRVGVPTFFSLLHSLRGLTVDVADEKQHILIAFH